MIKKLFHFITSRLGSLLLLIIFEIFWIWILAMWLHPYAELAETAVRILGGIVVVYILNHSKHLSYDNFWIILILLVPVGGTLVYFFLDVLDHFSSSTYKNIVIERSDERIYAGIEYTLELNHEIISESSVEIEISSKKNFKLEN